MNYKWVESTFCFIPNNISEYLNNFTDKDYFKNELLKSKLLLNQQEVTEVEQADNFVKFQWLIAPTWDKIDKKYINIKNYLEKTVSSWTWSKEDYLNYFYILSLEWKNKKKEEIEKKICTKYWELCKKDKVNITISWKITDQNNKPIKNATVKLIDTNTKTQSNDKWEYNLSFDEYPLQKLRIEATWIGKNIAIFNISLASKDIPNYKFVHNFELIWANQEAKINTIKKTISWNNTSIDKQNSYYIIKTEFSEYKIPFDAFVKRNWTKFNWNITAYMFEFNKSSHIDDLLKNDTFDDVAWYAWNIMKTFWMPFIVFIDDNGERIHILKNNPMILKTKIQEMNALKTNQDHIYSELTDKDMKFLVEKSKEIWWYKIDRLFLAENDLLRFPAFWVFDQSTWIWWNIWVNVISEEWVIETLFYTLSKI